jgi:hypothetical protein
LTTIAWFSFDRSLPARAAFSAVSSFARFASLKEMSPLIVTFGESPPAPEAAEESHAPL